MEDTRELKCMMFGEMVGGAGCVGGQKKEWMGRFLDDLKAFCINADQWTTAAQDEGEWRRTAEQEAEHFIAKWTVAEKVKAGLRHAVVCPNVTGRTKEKIAQGKRARAGSLALVDKPQVARTCILRAFGLQMSCRLFLVLRLFFVLLRSRLFAFVEAATLRSIVLRYAGATIATTRVSFFPSFFPLYLFGDVAFSEYLFYHFRFLFVWRLEYVVRSFLTR